MTLNLSPDFSIIHTKKKKKTIWPVSIEIYCLMVRPSETLFSLSLSLPPSYSLCIMFFLHSFLCFCPIIFLLPLSFTFLVIKQCVWIFPVKLSSCLFHSTLLCLSLHFTIPVIMSLIDDDCRFKFKPRLQIINYECLNFENK